MMPLLHALRDVWPSVSTQREVRLRTRPERDGSGIVYAACPVRPLRWRVRQNLLKPTARSQAGPVESRARDAMRPRYLLREDSSRPACLLIKTCSRGEALRRRWNPVLTLRTSHSFSIAKKLPRLRIGSDDYACERLRNE